MARRARARSTAASTFVFSGRVQTAETVYPRGSALPQLNLSRLYVLTSGQIALCPLTANNRKTRGVAAIEESLVNSTGALVSVRALRFLRRHPELKRQYGKTLALPEVNPHHPSLRLHALAGKRQGLHSVSSNRSCRITLELLIREREIIPVNVGDLDAVYWVFSARAAPPPPARSPSAAA